MALYNLSTKNSVGNSIYRLDPEIAESVWIELSEIEITLMHAQQHFSYHGISIRRSNGLILNAVLRDNVIAQEEVQEQLRFEMYQGQEMMQQAIKENNIHKISELIDRGLNLHGGYLPFACQSSHETTVKFLLDRGAEVNEVSLNGTCILSSLLFGRIELAKCLIEQYNANVNYGINDQFPLIHACAQEDMGLFDYFCAHGASVEQNIGGVALIIAIQKKILSL